MRKTLITLALTLLLLLIAGCASKPFYPTAGMTFENVDSMSVSTTNGYLKQVDSDGPFQIYETHKGSVPGQTYGIGEKKNYYFVNGVLIDTKIAEKQLGVTDTNMSFNETLICIENASKQDEEIDGYTGESSPRTILVELSSPEYIKCPKLTNTLLEKTLRNEFPYAFGFEVSLGYHGIIINCLSKYGNLDVCHENLFTDITQKISTITTLQEQAKADAEIIPKAIEAARIEKCLGKGRVGVCDEKSGHYGRNFIVRNNTSIDIKDVTFSCDSIAPSGTVVNTEDFTIYDVFPPNQVITISHQLNESVAQTSFIKCRLATVTGLLYELFLKDTRK